MTQPRKHIDVHDVSEECKSVAAARGGGQDNRRCPRCGERLIEAVCQGCDAIFVGVEHDEQSARSPYRQAWDRDTDGCALIWLESEATGKRLCIPCFMPYTHPANGITYPYWPKKPRLSGEEVEVLCGFTPHQMNMRAAHLPGRLSEHGREYDTDRFFREYYFRFLDVPDKWTTRAERKNIIARQHRRFGCIDPSCRKRHRPKTPGERD